jgi:hypothetical protein
MMVLLTGNLNLEEELVEVLPSLKNKHSIVYIVFILFYFEFILEFILVVVYRVCV